MNYSTQTTKNGVVIQNIFSNNFKSDTVSLQFFTSLTKQNAANIALLCAVLKRGNARLGEMDKINTFLEKNYGASFSVATSKAGEMQELALTVRFLDDRFAIDGEKVSQNMVSLLYATLFEPLLENGGFKASFVNQEKQNLKDKIASLINDKRAYSLEMCKRAMFENESYGIYEQGSIEEIDKITPCSLFEFFKNLIKNSMLFISYAGFERDTSALFTPILNKLDVSPRPVLKTQINNLVGDIKYVTEQMDVAQSKLNIGLRLGDGALNNPFAFKMFNVIFGSCPTSKLFMNVREKMSLCYYCASAADAIKNVMFIYSGIETADYQKALNEILHQLELMKSGDISSEEFDNARAYLIDAYIQTADSLDATISLCTSSRISGHSLTPEDQIEKIKAVTLEDVITVAKDIKVDTVYLLKGVGGEESAD